MKILIITNIRSGGTALIYYFKAFSISIADDPRISNMKDLDILFEKYDGIKLSVSTFTYQEYINIIKYLEKYDIKILFLARNNYKCALSIIKSQIINKFTNGYKLSYDLSFDKNIKSFTIPFENVVYEANKICKKYTEIKKFLDLANTKYMALRFEWLFDKNEEKYSKIYILLRYIGNKIELKQVQSTKIEYLENNAEIIYEKYCLNYKELLEKISLLNDGLEPFELPYKAY